MFNPRFYVHRERNPDELFPWDFIDHGLDKSYLLKEYRRALAGRTSDVDDDAPSDGLVGGVGTVPDLVVTVTVATPLLAVAEAPLKVR